jgi:hypothetical protein
MKNPSDFFRQCATTIGTMDIDQQTAKALGFPKPEYMSIEK